MTERQQLVDQQQLVDRHLFDRHLFEQRRCYICMEQIPAGQAPEDDTTSAVYLCRPICVALLRDVSSTIRTRASAVASFRKGEVKRMLRLVQQPHDRDAR